MSKTLKFNIEQLQRNIENDERFVFRNRIVPHRPCDVRPGGWGQQRRGEFLELRHRCVLVPKINEYMFLCHK
jgi:hypothetical protein